MGKPAAGKQLTKGPLSHFVLYADGYPVHSADDVDECNLEKVNVSQKHRASGKPSPKFHVVQRDIHEGETVSHDTIVSGDEENAPLGLTKVKGL